MMSYETITDILDELGVTYAYYQFPGPIEDDTYIAYYETGKDRFLADDIVYEWTPTFAIELYTRDKDIELEQSLIDLFEDNEVVWSGGDTVYIDTEKVYMTVYYV